MRNRVPEHPLTIEQAIALKEGWYSLTETRNQRNNNPGNIVYGHFAISKGATGSDGRFAKFATPEDGFNALHDLLMTEAYRNLTVAQALARYAPSNENDTELYITQVCSWTGHNRDDVISTLLERA